MGLPGFTLDLSRLAITLIIKVTITLTVFCFSKNKDYTMRLLLSTLFFFMAWAAEEESKSSQPSFFLIDGTDQLCLAGEEFKRCSIDSLFYVVGSPGT